jgi:hypothetical protein
MTMTGSGGQLPALCWEALRLVLHRRKCPAHHFPWLHSHLLEDLHCPAPSGATSTVGRGDTRPHRSYRHSSWCSSRKSLPGQVWASIAVKLGRLSGVEKNHFYESVTVPKVFPTYSINRYDVLVSLSPLLSVKLMVASLRLWE